MAPGTEAFRARPRLTLAPPAATCHWHLRMAPFNRTPAAPTDVQSQKMVAAEKPTCPKSWVARPLPEIKLGSPRPIIACDSLQKNGIRKKIEHLTKLLDSGATKMRQRAFCAPFEHTEKIDGEFLFQIVFPTWRARAH